MLSKVSSGHGFYVGCTMRLDDHVHVVKLLHATSQVRPVHAASKQSVLLPQAMLSSHTVPYHMQAMLWSPAARQKAQSWALLASDCRRHFTPHHVQVNKTSCGAPAR